jgi:hypothetical protein
MAFYYAVPLSAFQPLFDVVSPSLHDELTERLRVDIHAELARRLNDPMLFTQVGAENTYFDSGVAHGDIIFYSAGDDEEVAEKNGQTRTALTNMFAQPGLEEPKRELLIREQTTRYRGDMPDGLFPRSVKTVMSRARNLAYEFRARGNHMRGAR